MTIYVIKEIRRNGTKFITSFSSKKKANSVIMKLRESHKDKEFRIESVELVNELTNKSKKRPIIYIIREGRKLIKAFAIYSSNDPIFEEMKKEYKGKYPHTEAIGLNPGYGEVRYISRYL